MGDYEFQNDKVVNEMGRDGLTEHNLNTGENVRVSNRFQDFSYSDHDARRQEFNGKGRFQESINVEEETSKTFMQRRYANKVRRTEKKASQVTEKSEKNIKNIKSKESHMHKNRKLRIKHDKQYDYKAYGKLGRPRDYKGEEYFKYSNRLQFEKSPRMYRTKDLAPARVVRGGEQALVRKAESMYFEAEGNDNSLAATHEIYRTAKPIYRKVRRTVSHPVAKLQNQSYNKLKKKVTRYSDKTDRFSNRLDKHQFKLEMENAWEKYANENRIKEQSIKNQIKKKMQYKHAYRKQHERTLTQNIKNNFKAAVKKTKEVIIRNIKKIVTLGILLLLIFLIISVMTSCVTMIANFTAQGASEYIAGLFVAGFDDITDCDEYFSNLLCELQNDILEIEEENPDYDEYQYFVNGEQVADAEAMNTFIIYNQIQLASYLTVKNVEYTLENSMCLMDELFEKMFVLKQEEVIEQRERPVYDETGSIVHDADGNTVMEVYDYYIWKVMLTCNEMEKIMADILSEKEVDQWDTYCESEGGLQMFGSPFAFNWTSDVSSYYGYRNHPIEGIRKLHQGIDIAEPAGTKIYSIMDGTVTISTYSESAGNYIAIVDKDGYVSKYMHCNSLLVGVGKEVKRGELIALVGSTGNSTGNHLHLQIEDPNGKTINPLYIVAQSGIEKEKK